MMVMASQRCEPFGEDVFKSAWIFELGDVV